MKISFSWLINLLGWPKKQTKFVASESPWSFPAVSDDFEPRPKAKRKPRVAKATTRTKAVPKIAAAKKTAKKAK